MLECPSAPGTFTLGKRTRSLGRLGRRDEEWKPKKIFSAMKEEAARVLARAKAT